jgi:hypothetical protein
MADVFGTIPRKTALTMIAFAAFAGAMRLESSFKNKRQIAPEQTNIKLPLPPVAAIPNLEIPPESLDDFYAALRRTETRQPGVVTRILHYGDSPVTADSITADVRRLIQARFGDAGHGFLLIAKPWAWYGHNGVKLEGKGWKIHPASQAREPDGIHGLGGVSFRGEAGATSRVTLPDHGYARVIVYYLAQPDGGRFSVRFGEGDPVEVNTAGEERKQAFAEIPIPAGNDSLELRVEAGSVRLFGYRFDKDQAGVEYSSLGINGAQIQMALRYFEPRQWAVELQHEDPALVVLNYGTNESIYPKYVDKEYPDELRAVIARVREALPHASLILMGPMDRGVLSDGEISTPESLEKLIDAQRRIAHETGCAFFNTFAAMGGAGTMARWYHAEPRLVSADFMHPLPAGAVIVGGLFESALVKSYEDLPKPVDTSSR